MRKSATNSFTGGLNLDLNPLNTPNDILTDCLNGTLITFNGDELTLQNDAGNTKVYISYPTATLYNTNSSYSNGDIVYEEVEGDKIYHKNISGKQNNDSAAVDANQAITTDI
ncbi:MAG: hypothetical protein PF569_03675 [Candidatus Woesearchaeota archaeon]|jgi:hypothetical protein|nr:hypothetical protein [Candidatus Woesearchaeota archaeon]